MNKQQAQELAEKISKTFNCRLGNSHEVVAGECKEYPGVWYVLWHFDPYEDYEYLSALVDDLAHQLAKSPKTIRKLAERMGKTRVYYQDWVHVLTLDSKSYIRPDDVGTYIMEAGHFNDIREYFPRISDWVSKNVEYV